ncbi:hypothetical protein DFH06DRAFT_1370165 [Mycena polygramma]|nr:hypothetical protein DFH06DRAFT_1370165 [Mycena polygramma]
MHLLSALLLCAPGILASKPQPHLPAAPRTHTNLALRLRGPANATSREMETVGKRETYTDVAMTWYPTNTGPDACTGKNHKDSDWLSSSIPFPLCCSRLSIPVESHPRTPLRVSVGVLVSLLLLIPQLHRRRRHLLRPPCFPLHPPHLPHSSLTSPHPLAPTKPRIPSLASPASAFFGLTLTTTPLRLVIRYFYPDPHNPLSTGSSEHPPPPLGER